MIPKLIAVIINRAVRNDYSIMQDLDGELNYEDTA